MSDITAIGEILIDLTQTGTNPDGSPRFTAFPGGAPANMAVAAARLGAKASFIGKVGPDPFGDMLRQSLVDNHVNTRALFTAESEPTSIALVHLGENDERSYTFYRTPGADSCLTPEEAVAGLTDKPKILHFGSVSLTSEPARSAVLMGVSMARRLGALVSYDPNYRPSLWCNTADAVYHMKQALSLCDILKVNQEEMKLITGTDDMVQGAETLASYGILLVLVTLGRRGVYYHYRGTTGIISAMDISVVDPNGAGDSFFGAVLTRITQEDLSRPLPIDRLESILSFACKAASITVSRYGALPSMPTLEEVERV